MGASSDIMHGFVLQEIKRIYPATTVVRSPIKQAT